jgi:hypothetical protein
VDGEDSISEGEHLAAHDKDGIAESFGEPGKLVNIALGFGC